jgi:hypothetical protein
MTPPHAGSSLGDFTTLKMEAKRRFKQELHDATNLKTTFFIVTWLAGYGEGILTRLNVGKLQQLTGPAQNIYAPRRKHRSSVAVYKPLPSNGHCIIAYFAVVA